MDQIHHVRALYYEQGYNISEIAKATDRDWKTVAKYIDITDFNEPQPVPASERKFCPKLDPYKAIIDSWLEEDRNHPRKQRHTAMKGSFRWSTIRARHRQILDRACEEISVNPDYL